MRREAGGQEGAARTFHKGAIPPGQTDFTWRVRFEKGRSQWRTIMTIAFLILIIGFATLATVYLLKNSFARETLDVLFPAVGAILLSLYLGFKSVVLDAPHPRTLYCPVAALLNTTNGRLLPIAPFGMYQGNRVDEFRGYDLMIELPHYDAFKDFKLGDTLRGGPSPAMACSIVEYSIMSWLSEQSQRPGVPHRPVTPSLAGAMIPSTSEEEGLVETHVLDQAVPPNPFLAADPIGLLLPKGSSAVRRNINGLAALELRTPHSRLVFSVGQQSVGELLEGPVSEQAKRIYRSLGLPDGPLGSEYSPKGLWFYVFAVDIAMTQSSFTRYSKQAKLESEWQSWIADRFETDFSWSRLRAELVAD